MNRTISFITKMMFAAATVVMAACSSDDNATQALTVQVKVSMPEGFKSDIQYADRTVTMGKYTATTNEKGIATFEGVIPDLYDISTSCEITAEEYAEMTGNETQNENYVISGSLLKYTVGSSTTIELQTSISVKQSLIISKIYYAGTKDSSNKNYMAGKYIEFFNNSDQTVDIAGLYFGLVESESTPAYTLGSTPEYIYLKQIYRFPSNGVTRVEPGASIIVANSAIDHAANNEVDLSKADFEAKDTQGKTTNNPATPAVELIYSTFPTISNMNLVQSGPCSVVLFSTDENVSSWETVYVDGKDRGNKFVKTPVKYIMDGVECLKNKSTGVDKSTKRLYNYIDAGYQNTEAISGYTGEVIYRKIAKTENGRTILADTNNSSNDFAVSTEIKPREYK
ncbi:DUF4876 domain-containing protein [Bacteroides sp. HF-5092]|uniref:DUF4876 domain-containing protein n=1 Tax=Bacteroides TaxID=816 RepID=UPI001178BC66|nr:MULTISPECIES: DUF4876 domain-containing protein [Bacteroides]TRX44133.1 DUF4876 domain-containing protein [Bacteroides sp. HF-5092]